MTRSFKAWIILVFILAAMFSATATLAGNLKGLAPYDPALYETGYRIFMMNGNTADALILAQAALASKPEDRVWRKRVAQCADWAGKPALALEEWSWLALHTDNRTAFDRAMEIAREMNNIRTEHQLLRHRLERGADPDVLRAFVLTGEKLGDLDETILLLEKLKGGNLRNIVLENLSRLYEENGSPVDAVRLLRERAEMSPLDSKALLHLSKLQYGMGDMEGAYRTLKGALGTGAAGSKEYLGSLSDICWTMQDVDCSIMASGELVAKGEEREQDYQRLIYFMRVGNKAAAFMLSKAAWERYNKPWFFFDLAEIGEALGKWKDLDGIIAEMKENTRTKLARSANYWLLRSRIYMHLENAVGALSSYREALRLQPDDEETAAGYIWLLLDLEKTDELEPVVSRWLEKGDWSPEMTDALCAALSRLGDDGKAMVLYRRRYGDKKDDPLWLSSYADILERNNRPREAFAERARGIEIVRGKMEKGGLSTAEFKSLQLTLAGFMLAGRKGDQLDSIMKRIASVADDDAGRELVAAWAMSTEKSDFARWWLLKKYALDGRKPAWVRLGLALQENDREKISDLLNGDLERLPYRDAIEGARVTGALPLAEQIAWDSSRRTPDDYLLYNQLRDLYGEHPSFARYGLRLLDRGGVGSIENGVSMSIPLTRRFTLFSDLSHTLNTSLKEGVVANLPSTDIRAMAGISARFEKGSANVSMGWRSAVEDFPMLAAGLKYRLSNKIEAEAEFEFSRPADESVPLIIGGERDRAALGINYAATVRDSVRAGFARSWLRDQSRRQLGSGQEYTLDLTHKLHFEYPDVSVRAFGGYHGFSISGVPQGTTLSLIPDGAPSDASFFVPSPYWQIGLGASFGQGYRDVYTKNWKPFGGVNLSWKNDTGTAYDLELGAHGPLFGSDSLFFDLLLNSGSFGTSDLSAVIGTGYKYFFN